MLLVLVAGGSSGPMVEHPWLRTPNVPDVLLGTYHVLLGHTYGTYYRLHLDTQVPQVGTHCLDTQVGTQVGR